MVTTVGALPPELKDRQIETLLKNLFQQSAALWCIHQHTRTAKFYHTRTEIEPPALQYTAQNRTIKMDKAPHIQGTSATRLCEGSMDKPSKTGKLSCSPQAGPNALQTATIIVLADIMDTSCLQKKLQPGHTRWPRSVRWLTMHRKLKEMKQKTTSNVPQGLESDNDHKLGVHRKHQVRRSWAASSISSVSPTSSFRTDLPTDMSKALVRATPVLQTRTDFSSKRLSPLASFFVTHPAS